MAERDEDEDQDERSLFDTEDDSGDDAAPGAAKQVVSLRRDGLGPRLLGMVNAIRLAGLVGWKPAFLWPEVNGEGAQPEPVGLPTEFFDGEWAAGHVINAIRLRRYKKVKRALAPSLVATVLSTDSKFGVVLPAREAPLLVEGEDPALLDPTLLATFESIPFVPSIRAALDAVDPQSVADAVCVHVRRGDPGIGSRRRAWKRGRFVPIGLIDDVVATLKKSGRRVLLSGDERDTIEMLADVHGVGTVAALRPRGLDPRAAAFFDFKVMACAEEVLSSDSHFAHAAAVIGGRAPLGSIVERTPAKKRAAITLAHLQSFHNAYGPAERAATLRYLAEETGAPEADRLQWFRQALDLDPVNDRFARGIAASLVREGRFDEAERLLAETARSLFKERAGRSLALTQDPDLDEAREEIAAFEAAEEAGNAGPWIAAWLSSALWIVGRNEAALEAGAAAAARAPEDTLLALRHADLALRTRHHQRAHDIFERVLSSHDEIPAAHIGYTDALLALGYTGDALTEMARVVALAPDEGRFVARLAWYGYKFDRRPDTDRLMAQAMELGGEDPDVLRVLSFIHEERKDYAGAVALMERACMLRQNVLNFETRLRLLRKALEEQEEKRIQAEQERQKGVKADWRTGEIHGLVDTLARAREQELAAELAAAIERAQPIGPTPPIPGTAAAKPKPAGGGGLFGAFGRLWKR